jgi:hypothetical protein
MMRNNSIMTLHGKYRVIGLIAALWRCILLLLTAEIHANSFSYFLQFTKKKQFTIERS